MLKFIKFRKIAKPSQFSSESQYVLYVGASRKIILVLEFVLVRKNYRCIGIEYRRERQMQVYSVRQRKMALVFNASSKHELYGSCNLPYLRRNVANDYQGHQYVRSIVL